MPYVLWPGPGSCPSTQSFLFFFFCFVWFCVGAVLFLLFCLFSVSFCVVLLPFAPLHALALSLTGEVEEDGAREVETGFPSSDDAAESTITRYNATVAGLAQLCHCMRPRAPPFPVLISAN